MVTEGSVEERIVDLQQRKRATCSAILDDVPDGGADAGDKGGSKGRGSDTGGTGGEGGGGGRRRTVGKGGGGKMGGGAKGGKDGLVSLMAPGDLRSMLRAELAAGPTSHSPMEVEEAAEAAGAAGASVAAGAAESTATKSSQLTAQPIAQQPMLVEAVETADDLNESQGNMGHQDNGGNGGSQGGGGEDGEGWKRWESLMVSTRGDWAEVLDDDGSLLGEAYKGVLVYFHKVTFETRLTKPPGWVRMQAAATDDFMQLSVSDHHSRGGGVGSSKKNFSKILDLNFRFKFMRNLCEIRTE